MARPSRIALVVLALAAVFGGGRLVSAWLAERRRKTVFAATDAQFLLNPLRALVMPVGRTLERFGVSAGRVVLELGPGPGYYSLEASHRVGPEGRLICLDLQREMIDRLNTRLSAAGVEADAGVADATHLPMKEGCIDVAYLVTVLGEIPDPDAALRELHRVLKRGGTLGFGESFGDPDYVRLGVLREACRRAGFDEVARHRDLAGYTAVFRAE